MKFNVKIFLFVVATTLIGVDCDMDKPRQKRTIHLFLQHFIDSFGYKPQPKVVKPTEPSGYKFNFFIRPFAKLSQSPTEQAKEFVPINFSPQLSVRNGPSKVMETIPSVAPTMTPTITPTMQTTFPLMMAQKMLPTSTQMVEMLSILPTTIPPATMPPATMPPATMPPTTMPPATMPPTTMPPKMNPTMPPTMPPTIPSTIPPTVPPTMPPTMLPTMLSMIPQKIQPNSTPMAEMPAIPPMAPEMTPAIESNMFLGVTSTSPSIEATSQPEPEGIMQSMSFEQKSDAGIGTTFNTIGQQPASLQYDSNYPQYWSNNVYQPENYQPFSSFPHYTSNEDASAYDYNNNFGDSFKSGSYLPPYEQHQPQVIYHQIPPQAPKYQAPVVAKAQRKEQGSGSSHSSVKMHDSDVSYFTYHQDTDYSQLDHQPNVQFYGKRSVY